MSMPYCFIANPAELMNDTACVITDTKRISRVFESPWPDDPDVDPDYRFDVALMSPLWDFAADVATANAHLIPGWAPW
jgi:hypothetical protein